MPTLDTFIALHLATLLGVRWHHLRSQIHISMTTDDVEGEFMGSGAIGLFSSANGLCKSSTHF